MSSKARRLSNAIEALILHYRGGPAREAAALISFALIRIHFALRRNHLAIAVAVAAALIGIVLYACKRELST
jgi:hypothetical protein